MECCRSPVEDDHVPLRISDILHIFSECVTSVSKITPLTSPHSTEVQIYFSVLSVGVCIWVRILNVSIHCQILKFIWHFSKIDGWRQVSGEELTVVLKRWRAEKVNQIEKHTTKVR
jgi:hypothetical protein